MNFDRLKKVYSKFNMHILAVKVGQLIEVHEQIGSADNKRIWKFKGLVLKTRKSGHPDGTFTLRGVSSGIVVEKIYPFAYPNFEKIILLDEYKVKKSKLYYIRDKVGKAARMKSLISSERRGMNLLTETKQVVLSPIVSAA